MINFSMLTLNVRGIGGLKGLAEFMVHFQMWKKRKGLALAQVQEHNLHPDNHDKYMKLAQDKSLTLVITYGRADAHDSNRGGVLTTSSTLKK